jgi:hypothetical protein
VAGAGYVLGVPQSDSSIESDLILSSASNTTVKDQSIYGWDMDLSVPIYLFSQLYIAPVFGYFSGTLVEKVGQSSGNFGINRKITRTDTRVNSLTYGYQVEYVPLKLDVLELSLTAGARQFRKSGSVEGKLNWFFRPLEARILF